MSPEINIAPKKLRSLPFFMFMGLVPFVVLVGSIQTIARDGLSVDSAKLVGELLLATVPPLILLWDVNRQNLSTRITNAGVSKLAWNRPTVRAPWPSLVAYHMRWSDMKDGSVAGSVIWLRDERRRISINTLLFSEADADEIRRVVVEAFKDREAS